MREVMRKHLSPGENSPDLPRRCPMIAIPKFELTESAPLLARLGESRATSARRRAMEQLGQDYGFVLYRHRPDRAGQGNA